MHLNIKTNVLLTLLTLTLCSCIKPKHLPVFKSELIHIRPISEHCLVHTSYLQSKSFGTVPCNGMIYISGKKAYIFDTPAEEAATEALMDYITETLKCSIAGVIINHHHVDCLAGLELFHQRNIPSYAHNKTIALVDTNLFTRPTIGFDDELILGKGKKQIINTFEGEAHTKDNIISYIPEDQVLFGGCMFKSMGAGKGNLEDANVTAWPETIRKVQKRFPSAKIIIPGHGQVAGPELFQNTIDIFL